MTALEERSNKQVEESVTKSEQILEKRLAGLDERVSSHTTDKIRVLEEKLDKLSSLVDDTRRDIEWTDMKVKDCIAKAIEVRHADDEEEMNEKEKRKTNVIIHVVPESSSSEPQEREDDELGVVATMLEEINCSEVNVSKIIRLGRLQPPTDDQEMPKPRPIKMVLSTEEDKLKVLKLAKNLRLAKAGGWEKIFIHQDLTVKEREERRLLLQEKKGGNRMEKPI